ncbi:MAG: SiaC family regulatory phosphoprotein [Bacteroidota bacterium]
MEPFKIKATQVTPRVYFNPNESYLEIKGVSKLENPRNFYEPIFDLIDTFRFYCQINQGLIGEDSPFEVQLYFTYFNSGSLNFIIELAKKLKFLSEEGIIVNLSWCYDKHDVHVKETGLNIASLLNMEFSFFEIVC